MGIFKRLFQTKKGAEKARKYQMGLQNTTLSDESLRALFKWPLKDDFYSELEETLILADTGMNTALKISDALAKAVKKERVDSTDALKEAFVEVMRSRYIPAETPDNHSFDVHFIMGVNGVGKTTTIGKLAHRYNAEGHSVMVIAGDTFRAGAIAQLKIWADRTGAAFYAKEALSEPSSVVYEGLEKAKELGIDKVLIDTAGRLHNKQNLMQELDKMVRVVKRFDELAPHQRWLVLDATTGQNGMAQAKVFHEVADLNGIILTKIDGTAKGGIIFAIYDQFSIPIRYVGLGESVDDLEPFDIESYLAGWLGESF